MARRTFFTVRLLLSCAAMAGLVAMTTTPATADTKPATPAAAGSATKIAVVEFGFAANDAEAAKMASAVGQALKSELALGGMKVEATTGADRTKAARDAGAAYAVIGDVQAVGGAVRLTGQVIDVKSGAVVAPLQATGPSSEYFGVQDEFVRQARAALAAASSPNGAAAMPMTAPMPGGSTIPPASGSHWAAPATDAAPQQTVVYAPQAPTPPPPPLYGGYRTPYFGGGGYTDSGYYYPVDGVIPNFPLGTVRTEYIGKLGQSIIPPPPALSKTGFTVPSNHYRQQPAPLPLPAHNQSILKYKNPNSRFAAPVGQPQRAAPPNLRPGT